ncbi:MAG: hypothetical protein JWL95_3087, partial [Gemmatimonadetes bacterium]|nr:hypothetical protein [Gemmatimonadota bacterium]
MSRAERLAVACMFVALVLAPAPEVGAQGTAAPAPKRPAAAKPPEKDPLMERLLGGGTAPLKTVMAAPEKYRFQVLYGAVKDGPKPTLDRHGYRADAEYF